MSSPPSSTRRPLRITVLRGGPSREHDVSLASGAAVAAALRRRGHDVFEADIGPDNLSAIDHPADVVFPALHGTFGEDGTLQQILEEHGIHFVGSGSRASALAMDKVAAKQCVTEIGLATPAQELWTSETLSRSGPKLPLPVVVKPADQGSSVDTFIVKEINQFPDTMRRVVNEFGRALVEQFIAGDEITVGIVGSEALPPICVRPRRTFYDYEAKYEDEATEYLFEAGHPESLLAEARAQSWAVFAHFGCRHLGRVDWMLDRGGRLWFLELNTIPGFTTHSLVPKAAARVGISFDDLVERLVFMALTETT